SQVTPEFINSMVDKSIAFHRETTELVSQFYGGRVLEMVKFHKRMCDRYIENQVPMLTNQIGALETTFNADFKAWSTTVGLSERTHEAELDYLKCKCIRPLAEDELPLPKFLAKSSPSFCQSILNSLIDTETIMDNEFAAAKNYREVESLKIHNRSADHTNVREEWMRNIAENAPVPEVKSAMRRVIKMNETDHDVNAIQFEKKLEEAKNQFIAILEKKALKTD
ncbi:hypothetical protein PMAYCL1PPCAC_19226, partial [Pristionchus mayeri]